jgi:hypothetical protein
MTRGLRPNSEIYFKNILPEIQIGRRFGWNYLIPKRDTVERKLCKILDNGLKESFVIKCTRTSTEKSRQFGVRCSLLFKFT